MNHAPYVSVVIVGRNDDYGDNFLQRIQTFVRCLDHQVRLHPGVFELVIVEWNPLADRPPLSDILPATRHLLVRIITVSDRLHRDIGAAAAVLEFHGKNVGIRRAQGEFVLVTNPDILFTPQLVDELAQKKLRTDTVYRCDRYDFEINDIENIRDESLIDFAIKHAFVVHAMRNKSSVSVAIEPDQRNWPSIPRSSIASDTWHTNGCGDFMLASREVFFTVRGLYETTMHKWHVDSISLYRFRQAQIKQHVFLCPLCVFHQHHDRNPQDVSIGSLNIIELAGEKGSTDWGLASKTLPETKKYPVSEEKIYSEEINNGT